MGQSTSDLGNYNSESSSKSLIILSLQPIYQLDNGESETQLTTGNSHLDQLVWGRIQQLELYVTQLLSRNPNTRVLAVVIDMNTANIHVTLDKNDQSDYTLEDCQHLRQLLRKHNQSRQTPILLTASEAQTSLFYEDLGDLRLGLNVVGDISCF